MDALAIVPGTSVPRIVDRPEPQLSRPDDIKLRVLQVGICGTDREEAAGGRCLAADGFSDLVLGHELIGRVVEVGPAVTRVRPGDYAVFTVRRGCNRCPACALNRPDMCYTGDYRERGIWGLDGFQSTYVVDSEAYVVRVPEELAAIGVLTEPLSVVEKAIDEAVRVQLARLPDGAATPNWLSGRRCLVAGLGPIGLLAAIVLRLRGAVVYGLDIVDAASARAQVLQGIDGTYIDGRHIAADQVDEAIGPMDLLVEATGVAALAFNLLDALAPNGIYVLTGIPAGERPVQIPGAGLISQLVLGNQVMIGSVNASRDHFQQAVDDLAAARLRWGWLLDRLITQRYPASEFALALAHGSQDEIKVVLEW